jgi:DNA-binding NarL/FixJ family response regulator
MSAGLTFTSALIVTDLPDTLGELLDDRLAQLSGAAREALAAVAALAHPTPARVAAVSTASAGGLDEALDAGLVVLDEGRLQIGHPLYGSVAFARLRPSQRAALHRRLAELVDDSEERALHLAAALQEPDESVARTLIEAAHRARARGAPEAALELAEHSLRLWPVELRLERQTAAVEASDFSFAAGDTRRARRLLDDALEHADGSPRAAILERLATLSTYDGSLVEARDLAEQALACIPDESPQRVIVHRRLALVYLLRADLEVADRHAHAAVALADARGAAPSSLARALANAACVSAFRGHGEDARPLIARALSLEGDPGVASIDDSPSAVAALLLMYEGELDGTRQRLRQALARAQSLGGDPLSTGLLFALSELESRAGRFDDALALADRGLSASEQSDQGTERAVLLFAKALAAAHLGSVDSARAAAVEGIAIAERTGHRFAEAQNRWALGLLELSLGQATEAWAALRPAVSMLQTQQIGELGVVPVHPEAIEALLALGWLADAQDLLNQLAAAAHAPWLRAATSRCRGLVLAAGEPGAAIEQLQQAADEHRDIASPFALARTLQALGVAQRRAKRRSAARKSLESAAALFHRLGAEQWELRATAEIARLGGRRARDRDELTPTEHRIAELAASGRSNREIAGELFVAEGTVEANLTRAYRKLGVRSRTELARRLPAP